MLAKQGCAILAQYLRIQVPEKDVLEQQALVSDELLFKVERDIRAGFAIDGGRARLLVDEIKRLKLELSDFDMMCDHTSQIYYWATRGQISKPQTFPSNVIGLAEDYINEDVERAVEERTRTVRALLPTLRDVIGVPLGHNLNKNLCDQIDAALDELPKPAEKTP